MMREDDGSLEGLGVCMLPLMILRGGAGGSRREAREERSPSTSDQRLWVLL